MKRECFKCGKPINRIDDDYYEVRHELHGNVDQPLVYCSFDCVFLSDLKHGDEIRVFTWSKR